MAIVDLNQSVSDDAVSRIVSSAPEIQDEIYNRLLSLLMQFDTKGGKFSTDPNNTKLILEIKKMVRSVINESRFNTEVDDFLTDFDEIESNIIAMHKDINSIDVSKRSISAQKKWAIDSTSFNMKGANVDFRYIDPVQKMLFDNVTLGSSVLDVEKELRLLIKGQVGKAGVLERWVGQVARDSISQYQGTVHQQIKDSFELKSIAYVGPLLTDSRPQCIRWVKKEIIKDSQIESEIGWANRNGSGFIKTTTAKTFTVNRGGYNCVHSAFPIK